MLIFQGLLKGRIPQVRFRMDPDKGWIRRLGRGCVDVILGSRIMEGRGGDGLEGPSDA